MSSDRKFDRNFCVSDITATIFNVEIRALKLTTYDEWGPRVEVGRPLRGLEVKGGQIFVSSRLWSSSHVFQVIISHIIIKKKMLPKILIKKYFKND